MKYSLFSIFFFATTMTFAAGSTSFKITKTIMTQSWINDCSSAKTACANSTSFHGFDDTGALRLIYTHLTARDENGHTLPETHTAFVVVANEPISNFGNQFPADGRGLGDALLLVGYRGWNCPVTVTANSDGKVIGFNTPCTLEE